MWIDKYKPKLDEIPHKKEIEILLDSIKRKIPVLLVGPTGVGKTTAVYAVANEGGYDLLEINASDSRDKNSIEGLLGNSLRQMSLFMKPRLVLIDEVDGLSGNADRGGAAALIKLLEKPSAAIVMTANDGDSDKLKKIKKMCKVIKFDNVQKLEIINILEKICSLEKVEYDKTTINSLARRCNGDIRAAIIDLQVSSSLYHKLDILDLDDRQPLDELQTALLLIFKTKKLDVCLRALDNVDVDMDECMLWLDYNIPEEYMVRGDIYNAYDSLSFADIYKGRIINWQYWRFLVYQLFYMTAGVAFAKTVKSTKNVKYKRNSRLLKIWMHNQRNMKKKSIATKFASVTHSSIKSSIKEFNLFRKFVLDECIIKELELSDDEIMWLRK